MEGLDYNLLFRWFVGLGIDDPVWSPTRHAGSVSQQKRKLVEQGFGWMKTVGGLRKAAAPRRPLVTWVFTFAAAADNIVRLRRLLNATV